MMVTLQGDPSARTNGRVTHAHLPLIVLNTDEHVRIISWLVGDLTSW